MLSVMMVHTEQIRRTEMGNFLEQNGLAVLMHQRQTASCVIHRGIDANLPDCAGEKYLVTQLPGNVRRVYQEHSTQAALLCEGLRLCFVKNGDPALRPGTDKCDKTVLLCRRDDVVELSGKQTRERLWDKIILFMDDGQENSYAERVVIWNCDNLSVAAPTDADSTSRVVRTAQLLIHDCFPNR